MKKILDWLHPLPRFSKWKKAREKALEVYQEIPSNEKVSEETLSKIFSCAFKFFNVEPAQYWTLDEAIVQSDYSVAEWNEFKKNLIREFKRKYRINDGTYKSYIISNEGNGLKNKNDFIFVNEYHLSNGSQKIIYTINVVSRDRETAYLRLGGARITELKCILSKLFVGFKMLTHHTIWPVIIVGHAIMGVRVLLGSSEDIEKHISGGIAILGIGGIFVYALFRHILSFSGHKGYALFDSPSGLKRVEGCSDPALMNWNEAEIENMKTIFGIARRSLTGKSHANELSPDIEVRNASGSSPVQ